jgi:DNA-binding MarR family transcriptional regulator
LTLFNLAKSIHGRGESVWMRGEFVSDGQSDTIDVAERQALSLWLDVTSQAVKAKGPDLTARQTAMMLTIYLETGPHTVRGLAKKLGVGKPVIVRAIDALGDAGMLVRVPDPHDRRNIFIEGTEIGASQLADYARGIARNIAQIAQITQKTPLNLDDDQKRRA